MLAHPQPLSSVVETKTEATAKKAAVKANISPRDSRPEKSLADTANAKPRAPTTAIRTKSRWVRARANIVAVKRKGTNRHVSASNMLMIVGRCTVVSVLDCDARLHFSQPRARFNMCSSNQSMFLAQRFDNRSDSSVPTTATKSLVSDFLYASAAPCSSVGPKVSLSKSSSYSAKRLLKYKA